MTAPEAGGTTITAATVGAFELEFAGRMDFYLDSLNESERGAGDEASIGIIPNLPIRGRRMQTHTFLKLWLVDAMKSKRQRVRKMYLCDRTVLY
jgi:hypothetical protein